MDFASWDLADSYLALRSWLIAHPDAITASIFLLAMIEAVAVVGVIIPAIPLFFVLCVLAAHANVPLHTLFIFGILGAMAGDGVSYALGQGFKHRIETVWPFSRYPDWLENAEDFVRRHGGKGIIFGRFIGPLRAFVPMAAGIFRMKPLYFLWMNFLSALAWAPFHILPGYSLGAAAAHDWLPGRPQLLFIAGLLIVVAVLVWLLPALVQWRQKRQARQPLANQGRVYSHAQQPQEQRANLRLALFSFTGAAVIAALLPWLKPLDVAWSGQLFALRQPPLDTVFVSLSLLGERNSLLVLGAVLAGWLALRRQYRGLLLVLAVGLLCLGLPALLKTLFALSRPVLVMTPPDSAAFPSGHAFSAVLIWGSALLLLERYGQNAVTTCLRPFLLGLMLFTLAARPYLGVHWLSDVLAGGLLGLALLALLRWWWGRGPGLRLPLWELLLVLTLALALAIGLEVLPRFPAALADYQPLPGVLPGYLLLP